MGTGTDVVLGRDDRSSLDRVRSGDTVEFGALFDAHFATVYRYALQLVGTRVEAEDLAQEVFVLAWEKRQNIRIVDQSVLPWLLVTTLNLGRNAQRKISREAYSSTASLTGSAAGATGGADEVAALNALRDAIAEAVSELTETDQALFRLCLVEGLSYADAADALGVGHGAVRNRLNRLRRTLRLKLATQEGNI